MVPLSHNAKDEGSERWGLNPTTAGGDKFKNIDLSLNQNGCRKMGDVLWKGKPGFAR